MHNLTWQEFQNVDMRIGTIVRAEDFPKARNPAFIVYIDLGELGVKKSSAQITDLYNPESLIGKKVLCVTNFPSKQIGPITSEVLVCGFHRPDGSVVLATADMDIPNGTRLA